MTGGETVTPFGWWPSPLRPQDAAASRVGLSAPASAGRFLYWLEARPDEGGRVVVVRAARGATPEVVSPPGVSVRSRVHEYGGGAYCPVGSAGELCYVDAGDQRVYRLRPGVPEPEACSPVPPAGEQWCHGDLRATAQGRTVLAVRERRQPGGIEREVVQYALGPAQPTGGPGGASGGCTVQASGRHFYAAPRPSPDGRWLAYVAWDHPDMPWDSSEVWVCALDPGALGQGGRPEGPVPAGTRVAGGDGDSVGQPWWGEDGALRFAWDREGWWQPWVWRPGDPAPRRTCALEAEFHGPDWVLGQATMAGVGPGSVVVKWRRHGLDHLGVLEEDEGALVEVAQDCVSISAVVAHDGGVAWAGRTPWATTALWWAPAPGDREPWAPAEPYVAPGDPLLDRGDVAVGTAFTSRGRSGQPVHGLFFGPRLRATTGPAGERPPLLVWAHSGPTGCVEPGFDVVTQYFTTRGFAVAAVDYAGSTGYGRQFRQRLRGQWGVADTDDCVAAAQHLAAEGHVDGARMAIRGSSAGGLTALNALVRTRVFAAAVSWYGVTDLLALDAATHDFESRYNHRLVGPLPAAADEYRRRSPVNRVADMAGDVLLLQGLEDAVVPAAQSRAMAQALGRRGVHCEAHVFAGEGHGFRAAETIRRCLEIELDFYRRRLLGPGAPVLPGSP